MDDASSEPTVMSLDLLREITNDFSEERQIGSGSYGKVYLGVCPDGEKVAVKKLYDMPGLDDKQFLNEFNNLRRVQHKNIVRLVGYCRDIHEEHVMYQGKLVIAEKTYRALCLEYISNGSLDKYLSEECDRYNWQTCYRIIKGICQGLKYLHNELKPPINHLDLKPANILLDENMVPRIADFGISRLFRDEHTQVTKSILGTLGYSPPEFIHSSLISNKYDIFSLGVVIIKMMAGRAGYYKSSEMSSHEFTNLVQENWTSRLLETSNRRNAYSEQIKICIEIGLSCVQEDRHKRPTIQDIVNILEETETKCTYAARKDWSLIFQPGTKLDKNLTEEAHRNTILHYAPDPNDRHAQQIHHGSTVDDDGDLWSRYIRRFDEYLVGSFEVHRLAIELDEEGAGGGATSDFRDPLLFKSMTREQHGGKEDEIWTPSNVAPLLPPRSSLDRWQESRGIDSGEPGRGGGELLPFGIGNFLWLESFEPFLEEALGNGGSVASVGFEGHGAAMELGEEGAAGGATSDFRCHEKGSRTKPFFS